MATEGLCKQRGLKVQGGVKKDVIDERLIENETDLDNSNDNDKRLIR